MGAPECPVQANEPRPLLIAGSRLHDPSIQISRLLGARSGHQRYQARSATWASGAPIDWGRPRGARRDAAKRPRVQWWRGAHLREAAELRPPLGRELLGPERPVLAVVRDDARDVILRLGERWDAAVAHDCPLARVVSGDR